MRESGATPPIKVLQPTMTTSIDLDAYFQRIGYAGARTPTLETLRAIQLRHTETIAFENLNPLMRWPVRLDIESLQQKLVRDGRGGYCYEQNLLFSHVLKALGFQVTGLAARVLWNEPDAAITPRSHMLLCVGLNEKPYIADVGFGILTPTGPVRLEPDIEQATPHEPFRLIRAGQEFVMQGKIRGLEDTLSLRSAGTALVRLRGQQLVRLDSSRFSLRDRAHGGSSGEGLPLCSSQQRACGASPRWEHRTAHPHERR